MSGILRDGPPAHVLRCVGAAGVERFDVIDEVAGAGAFHRSRGGAGMFGAKCPHRRWVARYLSAQGAYAVGAGGRVVVTRRWKFGNHADLGVQNGAKRQGEQSSLEQRREFREHRLSHGTFVAATSHWPPAAKQARRSQTKPRAPAPNKPTTNTRCWEWRWEVTNPP